MESLIDKLTELHDMIGSAQYQESRDIYQEDFERELIISFPLIKQYFEATERLVKAYSRCEGSHGRFSCVDEHDGRCPKSEFSSTKAKPCECGSDEMNDALAEFTKAIK